MSCFLQGLLNYLTVVWFDIVIISHRWIFGSNTPGNEHAIKRVPMMKWQVP